MAMLRTCLLFLSLIAFAIGSVSMASARHHPRMSYTAELCTGFGAVIVQIGEDGQPVKPRPLCPDCVPAMLALVGLATPIPTREVRIVPAAFAFAVESAPIAARVDANRSRAPPVVL